MFNCLPLSSAFSADPQPTARKAQSGDIAATPEKDTILVLFIRDLFCFLKDYLIGDTIVGDYLESVFRSLKAHGRECPDNTTRFL